MTKPGNYKEIINLVNTLIGYEKSATFKKDELSTWLRHLKECDFRCPCIINGYITYCPFDYDKDYDLDDKAYYFYSSKIQIIFLFTITVKE